ncbi:MAG TPA: flippase [Candidatus Omnitrophota bacterium]|nr:flippase [Candidatus Omnitrophota bacterium]HPD85248.1 flippase [Candidatus Omnitrophota bacterium]HRZ04251.1 flippase [Candidatus Omnitrophota bacterium]
MPRVIKNTSWLFADQIFRLGAGLLITAWIARYLGPSQFGLLSYATAFAALFGSLIGLGLNSIIVRDIIRNPSKTNEILGSAFILRLIAGIIALAAAVATICFVRKGDALTQLLVSLIAAGFIFQAFSVIDFYFQSQVQSRYSVYAQNAGFIILGIAKILLILYRAPLIAFAIAGTAEIACTSFFLIIAYRYNRLSIKAWRMKIAVAKELLRNSWPLIFSTVAIIVYMRIDQIMIGQMLGDAPVGIYSAAVRISEAWYFMPMAIAGSVFPIILQIKQSNEGLYYQKLQNLLDALTLLGIGVAVFVTLTSSTLVTLLYGTAYAQSSSILTLHIWGGVFVCLGVAGNSWFIAENLQIYTCFITLAGGIANIALNLVLIPKFGIQGAALATVISQILASYLLNIVSTKTRRVFAMQTRSLAFGYLLKHVLRKNK